jgi:GDP-L-fucose synthase
MKKNSRIFVAGHAGMVGSAIVRALRTEGFSDIITASHKELDLCDAAAVGRFFKDQKPAYVFLAAARVGGIQANRDHQADFLRENLEMQNNVIHHSYLNKAEELVFLGSSCIYPRQCPQPMKEEYLLTGPLEPTNEGYALAKIAGLRLAQFYQQQYGLKCITPMPCNIYGTNDSFDPANSHVLSALVKRFVDAAQADAPEVALWGTGSARRELLHVDDLARALLLLVEKWHSPEIINVGCGTDVSIRELAALVAEKAGYKGRLSWDPSKPDGMPRKCLEVSKLSALGFSPKISLEQGIAQVVADYKALCVV